MKVPYGFPIDTGYIGYTRDGEPTEYPVESEYDESLEDCE